MSTAPRRVAMQLRMDLAMAVVWACDSRVRRRRGARSRPLARRIETGS